MSEAQIPVIILATVVGTLILMFGSYSKDNNAWEKCRAKHSKQVCINILQEVGDE